MIRLKKEHLDIDTLRLMPLDHQLILLYEMRRNRNCEDRIKAASRKGIDDRKLVSLILLCVDAGIMFDEDTHERIEALKARCPYDFRGQSLKVGRRFYRGAGFLRAVRAVHMIGYPSLSTPVIDSKLFDEVELTPDLAEKVR